ncbi:MAG: hypothetical protein H6669_05430 [Ardenticatenaceae bacterium]|nr:hypothetical protein [Ardenticatenaceae bacterium]
MSHNISALIFSPFLLLYILLHGLEVPRFKYHVSRAAHHIIRQSLAAGLQSLFPSIMALLLASALSAWFFVPALAEQGLAQLGPVTEGYFHFSNHFRGLDLVQGSFFFDYNPDGGTAFAMGLVWTVTAVAGLIILILNVKIDADFAD